MEARTTSSSDGVLGVHDFVDDYGNIGTTVCSRRQTKTYIARVSGLFDTENAHTSLGLTKFFTLPKTSSRKVLVVVEASLPASTTAQVEAYFSWCKVKGHVEDYKVVYLAVNKAQKSFEDVSIVLRASKGLRLRRRDLFLAFGGTDLADIVGFTAATYRRATPWILIPTNYTGVLRCSANNNELSLNYFGDSGAIHHGALALSHPPIAGFFDPGLFSPLMEDDIRRATVEVLQVAIASKDDYLLSYLRANISQMFSLGSEGAELLITAIQLAARIGAADDKDESVRDITHPLARNLWAKVARAIAQVASRSYDHTDSPGLAIALVSAIAFLKGTLSKTDLESLLSVLREAKIPVYDEKTKDEAARLQIQLRMLRGGVGGTSVSGLDSLVLIKGSGLDMSDLSLQTVVTALSLLEGYQDQTLETQGELNLAYSGPEKVETHGVLYEQTAREDVQYHVVSVPHIFHDDNSTLIQEYCLDKTLSGYKRMVLIIVDSYLSHFLPSIDQYFKTHSSAIDSFRVYPLDVSSTHKDMNSVFEVINASLDMGLSSHDLLIGVGGGTLTDIVGFAAAIYHGGVPYLRVPTTLVGMIDAGVGAKVGVNFEHHKSLVGSYYPPVACINDAESFLATLSRREFACGLAETIKIAILKSPRLFYIAGQQHRDLKCNSSTQELIYMAIRGMLEELQSNLYEENLCRSVDFGHEFGHIVESLADHEIPHGECVAVGMAISSSLAHLKGRLSLSDLHNILDTTLGLSLPIYIESHNCCDPDTLWKEISTGGIEHKDGKLYLAIPETIGRGGFLDEISDINPEMVRETINTLRIYSNVFKKRASLSGVNGMQTSNVHSTDDSALSGSASSVDTSTSITPPISTISTTPVADGSKSPDSTSALLRSHDIIDEFTQGGTVMATPISRKPYVIVLDVGATYMRAGLVDPDGGLHDPSRLPSPSQQHYPEDTLDKLQGRLLARIVSEVNRIKSNQPDINVDEVGISFGAVVTREGVVEDASILWGNSARGYDLKSSLQKRLPGFHLTIINDVSAAAWRYHDEGRFCLITVSSGLSNKVFNPYLHSLDRLDLDAEGIGGEMGHVVVEPRAVDAVVQHAILQARTRPDEFAQSRIYAYSGKDAEKLNAHHIRKAVKEGDTFALQLLEDLDVPYCPCGNIADLCSYSSGRAALRYAKSLTAKGEYDGVVLEELTDNWLQQAIAADHPLALKVLHNSTYPLALRILQLAADIGLSKFIIVGGFALKTGGKTYLRALQDHLVRLCHYSAYFGGWTETKLRELVRLGIDDDHDGLLGVAYISQHIRAQNRVVEKPVGESSLTMVTRAILPCGNREILARVVYSGICATDMQILRGERGLEPVVLGHEGVCQVVELGKDVKGVALGEMIILNPNNPLDDNEKLGHNREGLFQEYFKFGQEFIDRGQILHLGRSTVSATYTLVEPLSCVVAAQERIKDRIAGKNVLVVGAGLIGLLFVLLNGKMGARNVFLANRSQGRLDAAVAQGIISKNNVFVTRECSASRVQQIFAGEGVDVVIVCVSLGQGVTALQDAVDYVNPGGCVYLFGGFRSGDVLNADGGKKIDLWSIRCNWKTESVHRSGKAMDISGHRGSKVRDLATAAALIHQDGLSFGKTISHIISIESLPEIMPALALDGKIRGSSAQRVVVDMTTRTHLIETALELPLRHLEEASRKKRTEISVGNVFRDIGFHADASLLGWVWPPEWENITEILGEALQSQCLTSKQHFIIVGTGPWAFMAEALRDMIPSSQDTTVHVLHSLDPKALTDLFSNIPNISAAVCIGVTQSGNTMETTELMNTLRERFDGAGLDSASHFMWLTDMDTNYQTDEHGRRGESVIRSSRTCDWQQTKMLPLTVSNHCDINALFCAPHSLLMFLLLIILREKDFEAVEHDYRQYLSYRDVIIQNILPQAYHVASNDLQNIRFDLDGSAAVPAMVKLVTQLVEQALGSKQTDFNPRVRIGSGNQSDGFERVTISVPDELSAVTKAMLTINALSVFVATVAYYRSIEFVTHQQVDLYKRRAAELMVVTEVDQASTDIDEIGAGIAAYLRDHSGIHSVEALCYWQTSDRDRQTIRNALAPHLAPVSPDISFDVVEGEQWNHSRYQAAVQRTDTLYVVLVPAQYNEEVDGISAQTTRRNITILKAIAGATFQTLIPKSIFYRVGQGF